MQLFYHLKDELSTEKEFLFKANTETQFNHYDYDRSGTILVAQLEVYRDSFRTDEQLRRAVRRCRLVL